MTAAAGSPRLAIVGAGRMGRTLVHLAPERGFRVVAMIDAAHNPQGRGITRAALNGADVAVEFTRPDAAAQNVEALLRAGVATVCGTTGWYEELARIRAVAGETGGALFTAPNFSLGVAVFAHVAAVAARAIAGVPGFDAHLVETHHAAKKDAPSGTATMLAERAREALGREIPITSVRTGSVPGTHEVIFDAPYEQLRLVHEARDRRVFADGALVAARWLIGRRGTFTMADLVRDLGGGGA